MALLSYMAVYYSFNLIYPSNHSTFLSLLQTEVLGDKICDSDRSREYIKCLKSIFDYTGQ